MKSTIKILLVEDDPNLGSLLSDFLTAKGFETKLATDGEKGLKLFNLQSFEFLILDVMMPKKDGFTLAKEIRHCRQIIAKCALLLPKIILSATFNARPVNLIFHLAKQPCRTAMGYCMK